jgi:hypothetical protein
MSYAYIFGTFPTVCHSGDSTQRLDDEVVLPTSFKVYTSANGIREYFLLFLNYN